MNSFKYTVIIIKKILTVSALLLLSSLLWSCAATNTSNDNLRSQLKESQIKWNTFKKEHDASYQFVTVASGNTGPNKTVIIVKNDHIVKRVYFVGTDRSKLDNSIIWARVLLEDSAETLGKNGTLKKVDDYYDECYEILDYSENNPLEDQLTAGVSFDDNGLIANCGDGAEAYDDGSHTFHIVKITPTP